MARKITILSLPLPPSVNRLNQNRSGPGRGRYTDDKVHAWRQMAETRLKAQKWEKVEGPVSIVINAERPTANSDIDNRLKILIDFLVKMEVIDDDRNVSAVAAAWTAKSELLEPSCQIGIFPIEYGPKIEFRPQDDSAVGAWIIALK